VRIETILCAAAFALALSPAAPAMMNGRPSLAARAITGASSDTTQRLRFLHNGGVQITGRASGQDRFMLAFSSILTLSQRGGGGPERTVDLTSGRSALWTALQFVERGFTIGHVHPGLERVTLHPPGAGDAPRTRGGAQVKKIVQRQGDERTVMSHEKLRALLSEAEHVGRVPRNQAIELSLYPDLPADIEKLRAWAREMGFVEVPTAATPTADPERSGVYLSVTGAPGSVLRAFGVHLATYRLGANAGATNKGRTVIATPQLPSVPKGVPLHSVYGLNNVPVVFPLSNLEVAEEIRQTLRRVGGTQAAGFLDVPSLAPEDAIAVTVNAGPVTTAHPLSRLSITTVDRSQGTYMATLPGGKVFSGRYDTRTGRALNGSPHTLDARGGS
jgi:hypothetical protein